MHETRYRDLAIGNSQLRNILRGNVVVRNDFPKGVEIVSVYGCWERNAVVVRLFSPHFDPVPEGEMVPCDSDVTMFYTERVKDEEHKK